jgi:hypothetical protein
MTSIENHQGNDTNQPFKPTIISQERDSNNPLNTKSGIPINDSDWNWVPFTSDPTEGKPEEIFVRSSDPFRIIIEARFFGMWYNKTGIHGTLYDRLEIPSGGHLSDYKKPELPFTSRFIEIPHDVDITPRILHSVSDPIPNLNFNVIPHIPYFPGYNNSPYNFQNDSYIYTQPGLYPRNQYQLVNVSGLDKTAPLVLRGHRFLAIELVPLQFNARAKELISYSQFQIELSYSKKAWLPVIDNSLLSPAFEELYSTFFLSHSLTQRRDSTIQLTKALRATEEGCDYLIIAGHQFIDGITQFVEAKHEKGYKTQLTSDFDIMREYDVDYGDTDRLREAIKDYITDVYESNLAPTYVLLVGDTDTIPTFDGFIHYFDVDKGYPVPTDRLYFTMDGEEDFIPDILYGRFSVDTPEELNALVIKTLNYEQEPSVSPEFYNTIAYTYQHQEETGLARREAKRFAYLLDQTTDLTIESKVNLLDPDDSSLLISALNEGRLFAYHWGHGTSRNSLGISEYDGLEQPRFTTEEISTLTVSDNKYSVFVSTSCYSGWFDRGYYGGDVGAHDSFCEEITRKEGGGSIGAFGNARASEHHANKHILEGICDALWPNFDPTTTFYGPPNLGQLLWYGKMFLASRQGIDRNRTKLHIDQFHLFGDPELTIRTEVPRPISVQHPEKVGSGGWQSFFVNITDGLTNAPIEGAKVYIRMGLAENVSFSNNQGFAFMYLNPLYGGEMIITVWHPKYQSYSGSISVTNVGAYLTVSPNSGEIGTTVSVSGAKFDSNQLVSIYFNDEFAKMITLSDDVTEFDDIEVFVPKKDLNQPRWPINIFAKNSETNRAAIVLFEGAPDKPDLAIYCQDNQQTQDFDDSDDHLVHPRWDNPDIQIWHASSISEGPERRIVGTHNLTAGAEYQLHLRIHNLRQPTAYGVVVYCEYSEYDIGHSDWEELFRPKPIYSIEGCETEPRFLLIQSFRAPAKNICIRVNITCQDDVDPSNNYGYENVILFQVTTLGAYSANIPLRVNPSMSPSPSLAMNEGSSDDYFYDWNAIIDPVPAPTPTQETDVAIVHISVPFTIQCGDSQNYIIQGKIGENLVGGCEIYVFKGWLQTPVPTVMDQGMVALVFALLLIISIVLLWYAEKRII